MGTLELFPPATPSTSTGTTLPECQQASIVLGEDSTLPAWQEATHSPPGTPRAVKKLLFSEQVNT